MTKSQLLKWCLCGIAYLACACGLYSSGLEAAPGGISPIIKSSSIPPMRIMIVRSAEADCEPKCAEWISAEGTIVPETANAFRKIMATLGKRKLPVLIHSPGGSVEAAIAMGRMIRSRQLDVAVSKTTLKPCFGSVRDCGGELRTAILRGVAHSRGASCASACSFILAAGTRRFVAPWAGVGVHQIIAFEKRIKRIVFFRVTRIMTPQHRVITTRSIVDEKESSSTVKLDAPKPEMVRRNHAYLKEMGIPEELQNIMEMTPPTSLHWLTHSELATTHMATDYYGGESLVAGDHETLKTAKAAAHDIYGPSLPPGLVSFAYGSFSIPSFTDHEVVLMLEFLHHRGEENVEITALVEDHAGFIPGGNLSLVMQSGSSKHAPVVAISAQPMAPILANIPSSELCGAFFSGAYAKLTLVQLTSGAKISGPPFSMDMRRLLRTPDFVADICRV